MSFLDEMAAAKGTSPATGWLRPICWLFGHTKERPIAVNGMAWCRCCGKRLRALDVRTKETK